MTVVVLRAFPPIHDGGGAPLSDRMRLRDETDITAP